MALFLAGTITLPMITSDKSSRSLDIKAADTTVYGDVNSDGEINILDMILLKSYLIEKSTANFSVNVADLDGDGKISTKDAIELLLYFANRDDFYIYRYYSFIERHRLTIYDFSKM